MIVYNQSRKKKQKKTPQTVTEHAVSKKSSFVPVDFEDVFLRSKSTNYLLAKISFCKSFDLLHVGLSALGLNI